MPLQIRTTLAPPSASLSRLFESVRDGRGAFTLYIALVSYFWWPSLWHGMQIVHGDAAHHGLSLLAFLAEGLSGKRDLLWDSGIYGGHPLFAESQGGFANPINLLCALLFTPEYGIGVLRWMNMLLAGAGVYALCRVLGLARWPATFACITAGYANIWLNFQYNISVTGSLTWLPWLFASVENWLNRPTLRRASLMALPAAFMVFGGYPHLAHGAAIYLACYCLCLPLKTDGRALLRQHGVKLLQGGALALLFAAGLAAVQLLPLAELITQSHRKDGITMEYAGLVSITSYLRGLLFFDWWIPHPLIAFGSLSSISACMLAGLTLFFRPPARLLAHALATLLLFNLGMEYASPLFRLLYEYHLIPGLHSYRIMHPFFPVAVIGFSLLAAYTLDALTKCQIGAGKVALYLLLVLATCYGVYDPALPAGNFIAPLGVAGALLALTKRRALRWLPLLTTLAISVDALLLRSHVFNFYDTAVLNKPTSIDKILKDADFANYRAADNVDPLIATFMLSNDPRQADAYRQILDSLSPFPTLRWGMPSINGVLGLTLARRSLINDDLLREIVGHSTAPAGLRLIDLLSVKYISRGQPVDTAGFELLDNNPQSGVLIYKNALALPKIRSYSKAISVKSPQEALQHIRAGESDHLLIEGQPSTTQPCSGKPIQLQSEVNESSRYLVNVESDCPAWLFIADADYPGWSATINGKQTKLYPAQILGKAVQLTAGKSQVEVRYIPWTFYIGVTISLISLLSLVIILTRRPRE